MPRTADWFANLSKKAQTEYLKAHPNSKYAKGSTTRKKFTKENLATMQKTPRKKFTKENLATMKRDITSAEAKRIKEHEAKRATDKKKVVAKTPSAKKTPKTPNGKMSKETYLARITKQLRELRAKLKDVKPNTSTHRSLLKEIERLKGSRTKAKSR